MSRSRTLSSQNYIIDNIKTGTSAALAIISNIFRSSTPSPQKVKEIIKERLKFLTDPKVLNEILLITNDLITTYIKTKLEDIFITKYSKIAQILDKVFVEKKILTNTNYFEKDFTLVRDISKTSPIECYVSITENSYLAYIILKFYPSILFKEGIEAIKEDDISKVSLKLVIEFPFDKEPISEVINKINFKKYIESNADKIHIFKGHEGLESIDKEKLLTVIEMVKTRFAYDFCMDSCRTELRHNISRAIIDTANSINVTLNENEVSAIIDLLDDNIHQICVRICEHVK